MDLCFAIKTTIRYLVLLALNLAVWHTLYRCSDVTFYDQINVMDQTNSTPPM
jgi:hypothetical protein